MALGESTTDLLVIFAWLLAIPGMAKAATSPLDQSRIAGPCQVAQISDPMVQEFLRERLVTIGDQDPLLHEQSLPLGLIRAASLQPSPTSAFDHFGVNDAPSDPVQAPAPIVLLLPALGLLTAPRRQQLAGEGFVHKKNLLKKVFDVCEEEEDHRGNCAQPSDRSS
jgi:hypothetical protein